MSALTEKAAALLAYLEKNARQSRTSDRPSVAELLAQSRAAHEVYRRSVRHRANGVVVEGNPVQAAEAVVTAARLRAQAEVADPNHFDNAWTAELADTKFPHTAMVEFYESEVRYYLPDASVVVDTPPVEIEPVKDVEPVKS